MRKLRIIVPIIIALVIGFTAGVTSTQGANVLKGAVIAVLVDQFSGQLNKAVNSLTANKKMPSNLSTKVVPILSIGSGGYVGAAQVSGPKADVAKVKAVGQLETGFGKQFRIKAFVPINARGVSNIKRVHGVGVSAVIDVKI
jgi:hypothetical protein